MENTFQSYQFITKSRAFVTFVYIALFSTTLIFVGNLFQDYSDGATFFSITKEPVNKGDIPTATVCFLTNQPMTYGRDFTIQVVRVLDPGVKSQKYTLFNLTEGYNVYNTPTTIHCF